MFSDYSPECWEAANMENNVNVINRRLLPGMVTTVWGGADLLTIQSRCAASKSIHKGERVRGQATAENKDPATGRGVTRTDDCV